MVHLKLTMSLVVLVMALVFIERYMGFLRMIDEQMVEAVLIDLMQALNVDFEIKW